MSDSEGVQELREELFFLGGATFISSVSMVLFGLGLVVDAWQTESAWMTTGLVVSVLAFTWLTVLGLRTALRNRRSRRVSGV